MEQVLDFFAAGQMMLIDKPLDWTSFNVVAKLRNTIKNKKAKIGHAGTLDPLATGLLIICTGKFTKRINEYMAKQKEYTGTITLGASTPTYDLESEPENFQSVDHLTMERLQEATKQFTGLIMQKPPAHSAIKQNGQPIYLKARKGIDVVIEPRPVTIHSFEITRFVLPEVDFKVICSTGTYIRSLANDYGAALGVGGYLSSLRRTAIGEFRVDDAMDIETAKTFIEANRAQVVTIEM